MRFSSLVRCCFAKGTRGEAHGGRANARREAAHSRTRSRFTLYFVCGRLFHFASALFRVRVNSYLLHFRSAFLRQCCVAFCIVCAFFRFSAGWGARAWVSAFGSAFCVRALCVRVVGAFYCDLCCVPFVCALKPFVCALKRPRLEPCFSIEGHVTVTSVLGFLWLGAAFA